MKKALRETQTLRAGCSNKGGAKNFRPAADPLSWGAGRPKFNQLEMVTTFTYKLIVVTDPHTHSHTHTHKQTHRQDRLQHTAPLSLTRSVITEIQVTMFNVGLPFLGCFYLSKFSNRALSTETSDAREF